MYLELPIQIGPIHATLTIPSQETPPTHKAALILHGQGGHRDYCYQKLLAHTLATKLGVHSLRIDFRGCGSSGDNADDSKGRVLEQDVEDIQACVEYLQSPDNASGMPLTLSSIVAHSRGAVAMFLWAQAQDEAAKKGLPCTVVPNLVNCSSRFSSKTVLDRYGDTEGDVLLTSLRHGKMVPVRIPKPEILSLSEPDLTQLASLSTEWAVLSVYGLRDHIIPMDDFANFANVLNRGPGTHVLRVLPYADHNFYGGDEDNTLGLPVTKRGINYNPQVVDIIVKHLTPVSEVERFALATSRVDYLPRWKKIEGVSNFRDVGGYRIEKNQLNEKENQLNEKENQLNEKENQLSKLNNHSNVPSNDPSDHSQIVCPSLAFRCASMSSMTKEGAAQLASLGVRTIFDLRSDGECAQDGIACHIEEHGIKRVHAPLFEKDDYSPQAIAMRYSNLMSSWHTYVHVYEDMLDSGAKAFRTIFDHILHEGTPFVFHCTAGKDRTGLVAMLLLLLAGVDPTLVAREYELTTIGLRPDHPRIRAKFLGTISKLRAKAHDGGADLEAMISRGRKGFSVEVDGFNNLISSRAEAMLATIRLLEEKYGGVRGYFRSLGYTEGEVERIRERLVRGGNIKERARF